MNFLEDVWAIISTVAIVVEGYLKAALDFLQALEDWVPGSTNRFKKITDETQPIVDAVLKKGSKAEPGELKNAQDHAKAVAMEIATRDFGDVMPNQTIDSAIENTLYVNKVVNGADMEYQSKDLQQQAIEALNRGFGHGR